MAKTVNDTRMDEYLQSCEGNELFVCSTEPTSYLEASSTYALADAALVGGDFTLANGDGGGRKNTLDPKPGEVIDSAGTATHIAICSGGDTVERVTTCTALVLTPGGGSTVDIGGHKHEIQDPT